MKQCLSMIAKLNEFLVFGEMSRAMGQTGHHQVDCSRVVGRQWQMSDRQQWHILFRRHCSQPISWLSRPTEKTKTKTNTTKQTCIHYKIYYNITWTQKTKARFGHLLWPPVWKQNGPIMEERDKSRRKWGRKLSKHTNKQFIFRQNHQMNHPLTPESLKGINQFDSVQQCCWCEPWNNSTAQSIHQHIELIQCKTTPHSTESCTIVCCSTEFHESWNKSPHMIYC